MKKMKLYHYFILHTKINSKWIKDLNVGPEIVKLLKENISDNLTDIGFCGIFVHLNPRGMETKAKLNQWDYIKLRSLCTAEEATYKIKRPSTK